MPILTPHEKKQLAEDCAREVATAAQITLTDKTSIGLMRTCKNLTERAQKADARVMAAFLDDVTRLCTLPHGDVSPLLYHEMDEVLKSHFAAAQVGFWSMAMGNLADVERGQLEFVAARIKKILTDGRSGVDVSNARIKDPNGEEHVNWKKLLPVAEELFTDRKLRVSIQAAPTMHVKLLKWMGELATRIEKIENLTAFAQELKANPQNFHAEEVPHDEKTEVPFTRQSLLETATRLVEQQAQVVKEITRQTARPTQVPQAAQSKQAQEAENFFRQHREQAKTQASLVQAIPVQVQAVSESQTYFLFRMKGRRYAVPQNQVRAYGRLQGNSLYNYRLKTAMGEFALKDFKSILNIDGAAGTCYMVLGQYAWIIDGIEGFMQAIPKNTVKNGQNEWNRAFSTVKGILPGGTPTAPIYLINLDRVPGVNKTNTGSNKSLNELDLNHR